MKALLKATLLAALAGAGTALPAQTAPQAPVALSPCRIPGMELEMQCGVLRRPLDPAQPQGRSIELHFAVLPALARVKKPDPIVFFAGGPGQSAIDLAASISRAMTRLNNRRDIILVDQRGTGRSAALNCPTDSATRPLAEQVDPVRQEQLLTRCLADLQKLPQGALRHYTTAVAVQDLEALRQALRVQQWNLVGASYGTRVALEVLRQNPASVRRLVLDGVAPPDMALPAAFSTDNQAALDAVLAACRDDEACQRRYPNLRWQWQALLRSLPRQAQVAHPVTGELERITLTRDMVLSLLRSALYVPSVAAALPAAIAQAQGGRFEPLVGLASAIGSRRRAAGLSQGMHFAVICAEDLPRLPRSGDVAGADFGTTFADLYRRVCGAVPQSTVPEAFYSVATSPAAALLLSGGADPATPPRHGARVAQGLGDKARHVVVAQAGHGVSALPCVRDLIYRFIDAEDEATALREPSDCAAQVPRPRPFLPPMSPASPAPAASSPR